MAARLRAHLGGENVASAGSLSLVTYRPAPESRVPLNMRVPKSLKLGLEAIVRIWKLRADARGDDPTNIDLTHVATTLLEGATAAEFAEYGGERPKDDAAWARVDEAIRAGVAAAASKARK